MQIIDAARVIGFATKYTASITTEETGVIINAGGTNVKYIGTLIQRKHDGVTQCARVISPRGYICDSGNIINGVEWSSDLTLPDNVNTFSNIVYQGDNIVAFSNIEFTAPYGSWSKGDIIIAKGVIHYYDGVSWT